jgi:hypothetical protein
LDEEKLTFVVGDGCPDGHRGRLIAGDAGADFLHPFTDVTISVEDAIKAALGGGLHVSRDLQDLLEAFAFVLALGETETSARNARQRLRPAKECLFRNGIHGLDASNDV